MNPTIVSLDTPEQIVTTRLLDAPRDRVFDAFTRAEHASRWFGPDGSTITAHEMDVRAGGLWRYTVHGPNGTDYPNRVVYLVVDPPTRLVYTNDDGGGGAPWFHVTVGFEPRGERSLLTMRSMFASAAARDEAVAQFGAADAARRTVDRLAAALVTLPHPRDIVATRDIGAGPAAVWRAWTDPELLARWWGPQAFACRQCEFDARPDGRHRIVLQATDGTAYPVRGRIVEIDAPTRLVMTLDCSEHPAAWHDAVKPGRAADEANPAGVMLLTASLEPLADGGTRLTVRVHLHSAGMRDALLALGLGVGGSEGLDRLAALLDAAA